MAVRGLRGQRSVCVSGKIDQVVAETILRNVQIEVQHLHCFNNRRGMIVALVVRQLDERCSRMIVNLIVYSFYRFQSCCVGIA